MARTRQGWRKSSVRKARRVLPVSSRRTALEVLEGRRVLTGYFNQIADSVAGPSGAIANIESGLAVVNSVTRLPLINKSISQISQLRDTLAEFRSDLYTTVQSLDPASGQAAVQHALFEALGPNGLNILASKSNAAQVVENDVVVAMNSSGVDISIDIGFTGESFSSSGIGLGIDAIPLRPQSNSTGAFEVSLKYHDFHFGFNTSQGVYFRTDTSANELQFKLEGFLPPSFTAGLGFLNVSVTDNTPGPDLTLTLTSDVTGSLGASNPIGLSTPTLSGGLDLQANIMVQVDGEGMPKLQTDLVLQWTLPNVSASVPLGTGWGAPILRFDNVQIELGALLGDIAQPIAKDVRALIKPLEPIFDVLQARIPAVSDISEFLGGSSMSLIDMSKALSALPVPPTGVINMINSAAELREYAETVKKIADLGAGGWINLGSFTISGPSGNSLLSTASAILGDANLERWSSLVSSTGQVNLDGVKQQIVGLLGSDLGNEVNDLFEQLTDTGDQGGLTFDFPIIEDPTSIVVGMLLGQDHDMVSVTGRLDLSFDDTFTIPIIPLFSIDITAHGGVHAFAQIGYDTRGLREAVAPLYTGGNFDASKILDGLWVHGDTHVDVDGSVKIGPTFGFPAVLTFNASGGVEGILHAGLTHPANYNPANFKLRPFAGDFSEDLFDVNGRLLAFADVTLKIGLDTPFGFAGFDKTWRIAEVTMFEFSTSHLGMPGTLVERPQAPPQLYQYDSATHTLYLNAGDEADNFTVDHVRRLVFLGLPSEGTRYSDVFDISAHGITQRFTGWVDRVVAVMGDGNDTLKVTDIGSETLYLLYGGEGEDTIDIDGEVDFTIEGGAGNDTIDAGSGRNSEHKNSVNGGLGSDVITFGGGVLSHVVSGTIMYLVRSDDDQSKDYLTIDNTRARNNFFYSFYGNLAPYGMSFNIGQVGAPDRWIYMSTYDVLYLYSGSGDDSFSGMPNTFSQLYGNGGNDHFLTGTIDEPLPVAPINIFKYPAVTLSGGGGFDTLTVSDSFTNTPRDYYLGVNPLEDSSTQIYWFDSEDIGFRENLQGMDETLVRAATSNTVQVSGWDTSTLRVEGGNVRLAADAHMWWDSTIFVQFTPKVTLYDKYGNNPVLSGAGLDDDGPYVYVAGHRVYVNVDQFTTTVSFQVDRVGVELTPALLAKSYNVSFDGPIDSEVEIHTPDFGDPNGTFADLFYILESDRLRINSLVLPYTSIGILRINSGHGNDSLRIDGYKRGTDVVFDGGGGVNVFALDDSANTLDSTWLIDNEEFVNLFQTAVFTTNVASHQIQGGQGSDRFIITDNFTKPIFINGGAGKDTFQIGQENFPAAFHAPARFEGGPDDDSFIWYGVNNIFPFAGGNFPVTIDGGEGANTLVVDDRERVASPTFYDIDSDRIVGTGFAQPGWEDFNYYHMSQVTISGSDNSDNFIVHTLSDDTDWLYIVGKGGDDIAVLAGLDAQGNPALLSNVSFDGGADFDRILLADNGKTQGTAYSIDNVSGLTNVNNFSGHAVSLDRNVEQAELRAGSGDDTFTIESYQGPETAFIITAGDGDDLVQLAPTSGRLSHNISPAAAFAFDGGNGTDTFTVNNTFGPEGYFYTRNGDLLTIARGGDPTPYNYSPIAFENMIVTGGDLNDQFVLEALPAGQSLSYFGGGGFDGFSIGHQSHNTQAVQGRVFYDAGAGSGNLYLDDTANTTGVRLHIDPQDIGLLGAAPGDNFFGPGGALQFTNVSDDPDGIGLRVALGSGRDVVYAAPQVSASLSISEGLPLTDELHLALAGVINPLRHFVVAGIGSLTSDSHKTVHWSGADGVLTDYVIPPSFIVTNTLDSGPGSLRQAMINANATPNVGGPDVIRFLIPGTGTHTIQPLSQLPTIADPVILDASTQPGYAGTPVVELDGSLAGNSHGLSISSGGTTVRGLVINRFVGSPSGLILITGPGGNVIQGNYLGTNLAGSSGFAFAGQATFGIIVFGSSGNILGTDGDGSNDAAEGNLISGSNTAGILLEDGQPGQLASNNVIAGNRIGTNVDGTAALPNGRMGVFILGTGTNNRIGTNSDGISDAAERNLISGNPEAGIYTNGGTFVVAGNYIGTTAAGNAALPNGTGIRIEGASNNRIGGTAAGAGNLIAFNTNQGISIERGTGNSVLGNSITNNGQLGINLWTSNDPANFVTPNDATDSDTGSNNLQNFPQISTALVIATQTAFVAGTLQSTPNTTFRVEFFANAAADASGNGEGQTFLGFTTVTTNSSGLASFSTTLATSAVGQFITATATDPNGNTSEFSAGVKLVDLGSATNVALLHVPATNAPFIISSPVGATITATVSSTAGVTPPNGLTFPFGFVTFTVRGLAPGAATTVLIAGLDAGQIGDYYKYGPTPVTRSNHWYDFLYNQATDRDSATGTGMEIVGGNLILHLIDGRRGDDDLTANGVIVDVGGPVLNHPPVATNDTATTNEDTLLSLATSSLLGNDKDSDADTLAITAVGNALHGTVLLVGNTVKFTPEADYYGTAGFDYTLNDGYLTATGHVTVTVKEVNDAPVANPDTASLLEDGTIDIAVLANDTKGPANESSQTLTIKSATASHGTVTINSNGALRYRPAANYFGADTIKYTISDNGTTAGKSSPLTANGTVAVTVLPVNDAPVANDQSASVTEDGKISIKLNGSDLETAAGSLLFTITALPTQGQLSTQNGTPVQIGDRFTGAPTLVYKPGAAREGGGADSFKYTVTDNGGSADALSDGANVALTITKAVDDGKVTIDSNGIVRIGGTSGNDTISATKSGSKLQVTINNKVVSNSTSLSSVKEIHVWGRAGNDKINILLVDVPTVLHGGTGNDELFGGLGSALIFGDAGNDKLVGGFAANLLIGGDGADTLIDAFGDDVLVGGNLSSQLTDDLLRQMVQQWDGNRTQNARFLAGVMADNATDALYNSLGDDWFLVDATDLVKDLDPRDHDLITRL